MKEVYYTAPNGKIIHYFMKEKGDKNGRTKAGNTKSNNICSNGNN